MNGLIDLAFARGRTVLLTLLFILIAGTGAYQSIPKEAEPDIAVPIIYVSMTHDGISPEDAERLLIRPMEKELQSIDGVKEIKGTAREGHASVQLEFAAGFDSKRALADVRERVDIARAKLPEATDEPRVNEVNVALFPVLTVGLSGRVPERSLVRIARDLKDRVEALPGVLEVDIGGDREALMEVVVDPAVMETYGVSFNELFDLISSNNLLVAAGAMDTGAGRLVLKVPGVVETIEDMLAMPVKAEGDRVVTFGDVASVRQGFKDPEGFARVGGLAAVTLEVKKRVGANIIDTIAQVREVVESEREHWPAGLEVAYMQDKSDQIREMLGDLQNNIVSAILLVMIVIIAALGPRSALLVGMAIPGSFLAAILILDTLGFTLNIVVLFSLILVVGMLVDGAIVVTELADRRMRQGQNPADAFAGAAKRMAWPVTGSTLTTLAVFLPLLFWPGMVGEFMKFLPITVIIALTASLAMALVFLPVLGVGITGRRGPEQATGEPVDGPVTRAYARVLERILRHPGKTLLAALLALAGSYAAYFQLGKGVEFFPDVEPELALIQIHARGDLSIREKDLIVRQVEQRILGMPELEAVYARSFNSASGQNTAEDAIGTIQLELADWDRRRKAARILDEIRERTADIPGVVLEIRKAENGPSEGKPIQMELSSRDTARIPAVAGRIREVMDRIGGFADAEDDRPLPGIEWRLEVDRERAARYGADVAVLGNAVQMVTQGIKVSEYRPDDSDDEVDIRVRFPYSERNLGQLDALRVPTAKGMVPITNFVRVTPAPKTGTLHRVDARRVVTIQADVEDGCPRRRSAQAPAGRLGRGGPGSPRERHLQGRGRRSARGSRVPGQGVPDGHFPDGPDPGHPVQQPLPGGSSALGDRLLHRRGADGPVGHRPAVRHRHGGARHHRAGRHRREQQHRPDRHLQPDASGGPGLGRGRAGNGAAAPSPGVPDRVHHRAGVTADGAGDEYRSHRALGELRRAVDPVVDPARQRHRRRPELRDPADAGSDPLPVGAGRLAGRALAGDYRQIVSPRQGPAGYPRGLDRIPGVEARGPPAAMVEP